MGRHRSWASILAATLLWVSPADAQLQELSLRLPEPTSFGEPITLDLTQMSPELRQDVRDALDLNRAAPDRLSLDRLVLWTAMEEVAARRPIEIEDFQAGIFIPPPFTPKISLQDPFFRRPFDPSRPINNLPKWKSLHFGYCTRQGMPTSICQTEANSADAIANRFEAEGEHCTSEVVTAYLKAAKDPASAAPEAFADFDSACLSPIPRTEASRAERIGQPPVFGADPLSALALIQRRRGESWDHHCAGLMTRPASGKPAILITARHCFNNQALREALKAREFRVVRATRIVEAWPLAGTVTGPTDLTNVREDWLELEMPEAPADLSLPLVRFEQAAPFSDLVVVSYFIHHDRRASAGAPQAVAGLAPPDITLGLRWSRMCASIIAKNGCVRMLCQSERGFSGAPIFAARPAPDGALIVNGVVSQADITGGRAPLCNAPDYGLIGSGATLGALQHTS